MYGTFDFAWDALKRDETGKEASNAGRTYLSCPDIHLACLAGLSEEEVKTLFYDELWLSSGCNYLPLGVDYLVFDCAYRFSKRSAITWAQLAFGAEPTGALGSAGWLKRNRYPEGVIDFISDLAQRRMRNDPLWCEQKYWMANRNARAVSRARKLELEPLDVAA